MSKQLLYYEEAAPVSSEHHRDWSLEPSNDFSFASASNAVPLVAGEFGVALDEYAIVFLESGDSVQPVAILGVKPEENLFVKTDGGWDARYIPAFVRRYPFVFSKHSDGEHLTLCIDEKFAGWNQEGRGERLFDDQGERTPYLERVLGFAQDYQRQLELTHTFGKQLRELDLLQDVSARFDLPDGGKGSLGGFKAVERDRLKALPGETLSKLAKSEALELIYAHLLSLKNIRGMVRRFRAGSEGAEQAG